MEKGKRMKKSKGPQTVRRLAAAGVFLLSLAAFGTGISALSGLFAFQAGPAFARVFASFAWPAFFIVALILGTAFLFGRFYCAALCPLGILQDILGSLFRRKGRTGENYRRLRYTIAGVTFGLLAAGGAIGFRLLDPYTEFGAIAAALFSPAWIEIHNLLFPGNPLTARTATLLSFLTGAVPFLILAGFVFWKKRIYCTAICPVGTVLGLCAARGVLRLSLSDKCVRCGRCVGVCPSGCIRPADRFLDNERCVRCMNCMAVCPVGAITYGRIRKAAEKTDESRRRFLTGSAAAAAGIGIGVAGGLLLKSAEAEEAIYPPGAGSAARFAARCTSCQLCVANCRGNVLRPAGLRYDAVHLEFDRGMCEFTCKRCTEVCPTGALQEMTLKQKQRRRIGLARFAPYLCVAVVDGTDCGACAEHCPTGALRMVEDGQGHRTPELTEDLCIGCGSCEHPCPVRPVRAIRVFPVSIQVEAADPEEFFRRNAPREESPADGEWLI